MTHATQDKSENVALAGEGGQKFTAAFDAVLGDIERLNAYGAFVRVAPDHWKGVREAAADLSLLQVAEQPTGNVAAERVCS